MESNQPSDQDGISFAELLKKHSAQFQGHTLRSSSVAVQPALRCQLGGCGCEWNTFVWVSKALECIWFEIPKNASSSFKAAISLGQQNPLAFEMFSGSPDNAVARYPHFKRFAIIREPFERIQSIHRMFCLSDLEFRHRQLQVLFEVTDVRLTLARFLIEARRVRNHHWEQMVRYLPTPGSATTLIRMDESFAEAFSRFLEKELGAKMDLPFLNSTGRSPDQTLAPEEVAQIESMFSEDLELYRGSPSSV